MRRTAIGLAISAAIFLVVWWPVEGAVRAVFWGRTYDAKAPDEIAIDTLLASQEAALSQATRQRADVGRYDESNCLFQFGWAANKNSDSRSGVVLLDMAIHHERNRMNENLVYHFARESLRNLPDVSLGALQGCVQGSVLAGACRSYVAHRLADTLNTHSRELKAKADANDTDAVNMGCAALAGTHTPWPVPHPK